MIQIRTAIPADAAILAQIGAETFYDTYAAFNTKEDMDICISQSFTHEKNLADILDTKCIFLLAYSDNQPAGYTCLKHKTTEGLQTNNALEIARFYARTAFIGKGIGKALMQATIAYAKKNNHDCLWLSVWQENPRAIDFYKKAGFTIVSELSFLLGTDLQKDWLMEKRDVNA